MSFNAKRWRRLYEAARRDRCVHRFEEDVENHFRDMSIRRSGGRGINLHEIFREFVPDGGEILQSWSPQSGGPQSGIRLHEAGVNTAMFSNITGQIVFSMILDEWNDPVYIADSLVTNTPTSFSGERIPGIGAIGDEAEVIGEGEAYPMAGVSEEWIETPETTKRGFIVPVTKEAIFFDRVGLVLKRAGDVAKWLRVNKEKRVLDAVLGITNTYTRNGGATTNTYGDNSGTHDWDNLAASNALADWTDIENALLLFDDLVDPNTGEPVLVNPNTIIVPTALSSTAQRILSATEVREVTNTNTTTISANPLAMPRTGGTNAASWNVVSSQYVKARSSSASTWFIGEPQAAFAYMENWPISTTEAPTNSEMEFTHDIVSRFKVSERGVPAVIEPRKMVKSTA